MLLLLMINIYLPLAWRLDPLTECLGGGGGLSGWAIPGDRSGPGAEWGVIQNKFTRCSGVVFSIGGWMQVFLVNLCDNNLGSGGSVVTQYTLYLLFSVDFCFLCNRLELYIPAGRIWVLAWVCAATKRQIIQMIS